MITLKPYSASILATGGLILICMGVYFVLLRPPLLPEDLKYIKTTEKIINDYVPGLPNWLQKVCWVMGGYIITSGVLIIYIAFTSFQSRTNGSFGIVVTSGISSIAMMTAVNFIIASDFRFILLCFILPWIIALILYKLYK